MKCPECGNNIVSKADTCLQCGYPLQNTQRIFQHNAINWLKRFPIYIYLIAALFVLCVVIAFMSLNEKSVLPNSVAWGATYEEVREKDNEAAFPVFTDAGDRKVSRNIKDGSYLERPAEELEVMLIYDFGLEDKLSEATEVYSIQEDSSLSIIQVISTIQKRYTNLCGCEANYLSNYQWE